MTDPASIFRQEALRHHGSSPGPGEVFRGSSRWTAGAYWALLALVVTGLAASALVRVGEVARGPAVVRGRVVEAVVPAAFANELKVGMPLELTLSGRRPVTVALRSIGPDVTGAAAASRLLGTEVGGAGLAPGTLLLVRTSAPPRVADGTAGNASVQVSSEPLLVTLVSGLRSFSGAGDG